METKERAKKPPEIAEIEEKGGILLIICPAGAEKGFSVLAEWETRAGVNDKILQVFPTKKERRKSINQ